MTGLNMTYWWLCLQMCLGIFWHQLPTISAQIPSNACPQYFEYLQNNGAYIGRVTLPGQAARTTVLELQFSQREPLNGQLGKLELFNDRQRTQEDIRQGKPLTYRVHFPYPNILPKITLITVNGQVICAGQAYPAPSSVVNMRNTLTLSESIVYDSRPLSNPVQTFQTSFPNIDDTFFQPQNEPPTFDEFFTQAGQRFNPVQSPPQTFTRPVQQQSPQQTFRRPVQQQQSTPQRFVTTQPSRQPEPQYTQYEETPAPATPPRRAPQPTVSTASTAQSVQSSCGRRTSSFTPFIHHGTSLSPGQIPWLTAVYRKTTNGGVNFLCGGSLVSARTVITAAHCFRIWRLTKDDVVLHIGRHNLNDYRSKFAIRQVENVIIHQDYNASKMADADIAIMHFTEPVSFNELISPICLWNGPNDVAQIVGQKGYVAGWGADENGNPVTSIPKMVNADIVDEDTCVRNKEGFLSLVTARTLCAGNLDRSGPCSGDSGGGLMMQRDGRWLLRGIVSAGNTVDGMCNLNTYVLYCDLAKHMTWVQQNVIY